MDTNESFLVIASITIVIILLQGYSLNYKAKRNIDKIKDDFIFKESLDTAITAIILTIITLILWK